MIFNHPSAYIYSTPCPSLSSPVLPSSFSSRSSSSSPRSRHSYPPWTSAPHVGASEGPTWSPYLKSPLLASPPSNHDLIHWVQGQSHNRHHSHRRNQALTFQGQVSSSLVRIRPRTESASSLSSTLSSSSTSSSSPCFSFSEPSEDGDQVEDMQEGPDERQVSLQLEAYERMSQLGAMIQEPPSPVPTFSRAKRITVSSSSRMRQAREW